MPSMHRISLSSPHNSPQSPEQTQEVAALPHTSVLPRSSMPPRSSLDHPLNSLPPRVRASGPAADLEMGLTPVKRISVRSLDSLKKIADPAEAVTSRQIAEVVQTVIDEPLPAHVDSPPKLLNHIAGRLQGMLSGAIGAGMTLGAFRAGGAAVEHASSAAYLSQLARQMKAVGIGSITAGVANTLALTIAAPAGHALLSQLMGCSTTLVPANPEHIVPADAPDRAAQIASIRAAQSRFGVDSPINIFSGVASFGGLKATQSAVTANAGLSPGANYAVETATSFAAGGLTLLLTQLVQSNASVDVRYADGRMQSHGLFDDRSVSPPSIKAAVQTTANVFMGGRKGRETLTHFVSQVLQRGAIVGASTVALGATQAAIPTIREALMSAGQSFENANRNASAAMAAAGFTAAIICYFTLLGKIAKTLPK